MDILIKNMEMPKSCGVCSIKYNEYLKMMDNDKYGNKTRSVTKIFHVCHLVEHDVTEFADSGKRCPDCPLVEVPTHGELIDRDALLNEMDSKVMDEDRINGVFDFAFRSVSDAPTVLEASN